MLVLVYLRASFCYPAFAGFRQLVLWKYDLALPTCYSIQELFFFQMECRSYTAKRIKLESEMGFSRKNAHVYALLLGLGSHTHAERTVRQFYDTPSKIQRT